MNPWLLLVIQVAVGSLIGGLTNELAIRMLFRPYRAWTIGRLRVPFTPGLIPRRRPEIAEQMGRIVEQYLFTEEGIRRTLRDGRLEESIQSWLDEQASAWLEREETWRQLIQRLLPGVLDEAGTWNPAVRARLREQWRDWTVRMAAEAGGVRLRDLITARSLARSNEWISQLGRILLDRLRLHLRTAEGQAQVQELVRALLGSGGMFGGLVGMFVSDEKVLARLLPYLDEILGRPEQAERLSGLIQREWDGLLDLTVKEALERLGLDQVEAWGERLIDELAVRLDAPVRELAGRLERPLRDVWIPRLARWLTGTLEQNAERLFRTLSVSDVVTHQVASFPLERVEEMILGITGREFRMITLLGFFLGGLIGLVQGLIQLVL